jgi:hypothetical protein
MQITNALSQINSLIFPTTSEWYMYSMPQLSIMECFEIKIHLTLSYQIMLKSSSWIIHHFGQSSTILSEKKILITILPGIATNKKYYI